MICYITEYVHILFITEIAYHVRELRAYVTIIKQ